MANEKRLIDANALLKELDKFVNPMPDEKGLHFLSGLSTAITEIVDAPTVDAVEVVHAKWENGHCTNCKQLAEVKSIGFNCTGGTSIDYKETNYCPNCGAKMDL